MAKVATSILLACHLLFGFMLRAEAVDPNPAGELAVHVAISDDPEFSKKWIATAPSKSFVVSRIQKIRPHHTAYIAFLVSGHTVGPDGRPDVTINATIRKPNGSLFADMAGCCSVRYVTGMGGFVMADPAIDLSFDATDPVGLWRIDATASDKLAGTLATGRASLELRE